MLFGKRLNRQPTLATTRRTPPNRRFRPGVEALEDRTLPSTFLVMNTNDSGAGSLRAAIMHVNQDSANTGMDEIDFQLSGPGTHVINLKSQLPSLTHSVFIKGSSQAGFAGKPVITLNGSLIAGASDAFVLNPTAATDPFGVKIDSLRFAGFTDGVTLLGSTESVNAKVEALNNTMTLKSGGDGFQLNAGAAATTAILTGNTITTSGLGDGIVATAGGSASAFTFANNTVTCTGSGDGIQVLGMGANNTINATGNSVVVHNGADAMVINVDGGSPTTATVAKNVLNTSGLGTGLALFGGSVFQALVQGNNFASNLVGVAVTGDGSTAGQIDLGGGSLGSSGGNDFRSFRSAKDNSFAIGLFNVAPSYSLTAHLNLFGVAAGSAIADGSHDAAAGGSGSILL